MNSFNFKYNETKLQIDDLAINLLEVTNFNELFDQLLVDEKSSKTPLEDHIPYWTELWPSARGLALHLALNKALVLDKSILEIGCGLGLPSLVATKIGASQVVASDLINDALYHVNANAKLNQINKNLSTQVMDWTNLDMATLQEMDLILAADIVYEKRFVHHFIDLIDKIKNQNLNIAIIIAEPKRSVAATMIKDIIKMKNISVTSHEYLVNSRGTDFLINVHHLITF